MAFFAMVWALILGWGKSLVVLALSASLAAMAKYKTELFAAAFVLAVVVALHFAPSYERVVFGVANVVTFGLGVVFERKYSSVVDRFFPPSKI